MSGVVAGEGAKAKSGIPVLHAGSHFRHGLLQLMIHTIDPLHDGKIYVTISDCPPDIRISGYHIRAIFEYVHFKACSTANIT